MLKPSSALEGRRIRLIAANGSGSENLKRGEEGVVRLVDAAGMLHVEFDSGLCKGLFWEAGDRWTVLPKEG